MRRSIPLLVVASLLSARAAFGQDHPEKLGVVHFPVSCTPAAQQQFDGAVALLHNFAYPQDLRAFDEVAKIDSSCAMAYWGIAISRRANPLIGSVDSSALKEGLAAAERAVTVHAATQRERDYIAAIEVYYKDWNRLDHRTRVLAYEKAMEQLHRTYPDDQEAAVFYALSLDEAASVLPADKTYDRQLRAAAILEKVLAAHPDHPGALHYLIHTYDFPSLADRGVAAAERYGAVAPSASHALHMPSHVYSMLGMWQESIAANQASLTVAKTYAHAMDFMAYAYLQGAQDSAARRVVDQSAALQATQSPSGASPSGAALAGYTAVAAIPARYALERGAWTEAAALQPLHMTPVADAITYFVRAVGAARSGDVAGARQSIAQLRQLQAVLAQSRQDYWAQQVMIEEIAAEAWADNAEGKRDDGLTLMRSAADLEDASEKHIAMENRLWPMRELLGEMLLQSNEPVQALDAFKASLQSARNRYRGLYGAAKAAERAGDRQTARAYYEKLLALCSHADTARPELAEAKGYLSRPNR
jgi:tetratricopeptide (TPR) repeat protein